MNKIEDIPPKLQSKKGCNLIRSSPVNKNLGYTKKSTKIHSFQCQTEKKKEEMAFLSDDDDLYPTMTFNEAQQSLEDEIFEELEKVAHDEVKLKLAIKNFDQILFEFNSIDSKREEKAPSAIPQPLQKSKTCSIIESQCVLKSKPASKGIVPGKMEQPKASVRNMSPIASANCYQVTKSLWNLQDLDSFAKMAPKTKLGPRYSDNSMMRAKSVWDVTSTASRPSYSRQASISKIPIKSSKLSTSMIQLNASSSTLDKYPSPPRMKKTSSTLSLASQPAKTSISPRSLTNISRKLESTSPKSTSKYAETKSSLQRRNLMSSTNSLNRTPISIAPTRAITQMKSTAVLGKVQMPSSTQMVEPPNLIRRGAQPSVQRKGDSLLDKCLVKGQELLRKAEELNDANVHDEAKIVASDVRKRDYIARHQKTPLTKAPIVSMNTKSSLTNNSIKILSATIAKETEKIESGNFSQTTQSSLAKTEVTTRTNKVETPSSLPATLESCKVIIPVVLDKIDGETIKGYHSDCSEDSGHISNETESEHAMKLEPQKISEDLLNIFEKKFSQTNSKSSQEVVEPNTVNKVTTILEIYPNLNKTCKSEVIFFVNRY
jgi:hypothetical protein